MTDGIATLSLELDALSTRQSFAAPIGGSQVLREYVLGPENALVALGIGLCPEALGSSALNFEIVPLTLSAPPGLGKSQLLRALGATWARQNASDTVLLVTAADFARNYADAVKLDDVPRFQQRFQRCECLLIDDLDVLLKKQGVQQRLAAIIEHRQRHHRATVLTTRRHPRLLGLSSRLTSRLASGLMLPLKLPSPPTRRAILQRLCQTGHIQLSADAEQMLTQQDTITVPQLMGLLNQLKQHYRIDDHRWRSPGPRDSSEHRIREAMRIRGTTDALMPIDADQVRKLLQSTEIGQVSAKAIIRTTARYYGLPQRNLTGSSRRKLDVLARSMAMYLIREMTKSSYQQVGKHFGGRDHTTVMHAHKKMTRQQKLDIDTRDSLQEIRRRLDEASPPKIA